MGSLVARFQLFLQREPLRFELRKLPPDVGLVEDQRLQRVLLRVAVDRRVGELRVERRFLFVAE
jgi:hypothetical protein